MFGDDEDLGSPGADSALALPRQAPDEQASA
jgi:hypothetical protein